MPTRKNEIHRTVGDNREGENCLLLLPTRCEREPLVSDAGLMKSITVTGYLVNHERYANKRALRTVQVMLFLCLSAFLSGRLDPLTILRTLAACGLLVIGMIVVNKVLKVRAIGKESFTIEEKLKWMIPAELTFEDDTLSAETNSGMKFHMPLKSLTMSGAQKDRILLVGINELIFGVENASFPSSTEFDAVRKELETKVLAWTARGKVW